MNIKGLSYFINSEKLDQKSFSIAEWAQRLKEEGEGAEKLEILVDRAAALWYLHKGLDDICGGQPREFVANVIAFVAAFRRCGVEPVFIFGTPNPQERTYDREQPESTLSALNVKNKRFATDFNNFQAILETICDPAVRIEEFDKPRRARIAAYARENRNCVGILSNNPAYFILDLGEHCRLLLLDKDFKIDPEDILATSYERRGLCDKLRLTPGQLPLLATLLGGRNDEKRKAFHKRLCAQARHYIPRGEGCQQLLNHVADYVRKFKPGEHTKGKIESIVYDVFRESSRLKKVANKMEDFGAEGFVEALDNSETEIALDRGNLTESDSLPPDERNWQQIVQMTIERERISRHAMDEVVLVQQYTIPPSMEDFKQERFPPVALLYRPLRQALYWVLLKELPAKSAAAVGGALGLGLAIAQLKMKLAGDAGPQKAVGGSGNELELDVPYVSEWCFRPGDKQSGEKADLVAAIPLKDIDHPGLLHLWGSDSENDEQMDEIRWQIMQRAFHINAEKLPQIKQLPAKQLFPVLILCYLQNHTGERLLTEWELNAVLALVLFLPDSHERILDRQPDLNASDKVDPGAIQIAAMVTSGIHIVGHVLFAVGHTLERDYAKTWLFFDGPWFRHFYRMAKPSADGGQGASIEEMCGEKAAELKGLKSLI